MKYLETAISKAPEGTIPYGGKCIQLLHMFFSALGYCSQRYLTDKPIDLAEVSKFFKALDEKRHAPKRKDTHLSALIGGVLRLAALTVCRFKEIQRTADYPKNRHSLLVPSPLSLLYDSLIVPNEPASKAYALTACKRLIFIRLGVYPNAGQIGKPWKTVDIDQIESELEGQRKYFVHRDNVPIGSNDEAEMLQHILAMKGVYCLRFGSWGKSNKRQLKTRSELAEVVRLFFAEKDIRGMVNFSGQRECAFEFRMSPTVDEEPRALDVVNEIAGIPIPIRGADTIFYGGLRTSFDGSLVINVSGAAGTGKTSLALATGVTFSPYGTHCYYISTEETEEDLKIRLKSLFPAYLRGLSIQQKNLNWFHVADLRPTDQTETSQVEREENYGENHDAEQDSMLARLNRHLDCIRVLMGDVFKDDEERRKSAQTVYIPAICPLIVVIDSVYGLTDGKDTEQIDALSEFVDRCRRLRALVFVLSGEELPRHSRLSYMVDILIKLSYRDTENEAIKPERILQLAKTRFQLSRPGAHVFHMSDRDAFRISPQLSSQLDKEEQQSLTLPDEGQLINTFNSGIDLPYDKTFFELAKPRHFLDLYAYSHILLHGHGSSSKSWLALKVLLTPIQVGKDYKGVGVEPRRVLTVSFLYPKAYYKRLAARKTIAEKGSGIEVLAFSPGFLRPEDLLGKVARWIEAAELEGRPYTGVLLDGIHNVFLAFPLIQDREMLWPTLYRMLSIKKMTIVTTFTNFVLDGQENFKTPEEKEIERRGQTPLLHALVQGADFYLTIQKIPTKGNTDYPDCILRGRECIGRQLVPDHVLLWDRRMGRLSRPMVEKLKEGNRPPVKTGSSGKEQLFSPSSPLVDIFKEQK
ncbi:MAG: ATPase domain-containing protein [Verrucomicrobiota bacterium]